MQFLLFVQTFPAYLLNEYVSGEGVSLVEWANLIEEILPENRVNNTIEKDLEQGFDFRRITIEEQ